MLLRIEGGRGSAILLQIALANAIQRNPAVSACLAEPYREWFGSADGGGRPFGERGYWPPVGG